MIAISEFYPYVLPFAPSCPDPVADQYIVQAAIEFCKKTRCWRHQYETDLSGEDDEIICVPSKASLFEIERAWFRLPQGNRWYKLDVQPYNEVDQNIYETSPTDNTTSRIISQKSFDAVSILPLSPGFVRINTFLVPVYKADMLPKFLFQKFASEIADGALSKILIIPDQPYTNAELAMMKMKTFTNALNNHFNFNVRGQQRAASRVKSSFL